MPLRSAITRGMAVPTTVWSSAASSMPIMSAAITAQRRRGLRVAPQLCFSSATSWSTLCARAALKRTLRRLCAI